MRAINTKQDIEALSDEGAISDTEKESIQLNHIWGTFKSPNNSTPIT
ncbi:hypothetical protein [Desulfosporosinus fructosivorans]